MREMRGEVIMFRGPGGGAPHHRVESGPHEELVEAGGTYAELFEMPRAYR